MKVTEDVIRSVMSDAGGITSAALRLLGEPTDGGAKGWKTKCLGREIDSQAYESFIREGKRNPKKKKTPNPKKKQPKGYEEHSRNGIDYLTGKLDGAWWICRLWKKSGQPTVHLEYEWGNSRKDVLSAKGLT